MVEQLEYVAVTTPEEAAEFERQYAREHEAALVERTAQRTAELVKESLAPACAGIESSAFLCDRRPAPYVVNGTNYCGKHARRAQEAIRS